VIRTLLATAWIRDNVGVFVTICLAIVGAIATALRYTFVQHKELVLFREHMVREEKDMWPGVKALHNTVNINHLETVRLLEAHGVRIDTLEKRMPNGEIKEIQATLRTLVNMLSSGR
jgi:hypothetical protein